MLQNLLLQSIRMKRHSRLVSLAGAIRGRTSRSERAGATAMLAEARAALAAAMKAKVVTFIVV